MRPTSTSVDERVLILPCPPPMGDHPDMSAIPKFGDRKAEPSAGRTPAESTVRPTSTSADERVLILPCPPPPRATSRRQYLTARGSKSRTQRWADTGRIDREADEHVRRRARTDPTVPPPTGDHPDSSAVPDCSGIEKWVKDG